MPTQNPRIQVMLDNETHALLANLADKQSASISATAAKLIDEAIAHYEDELLSALGDKRLQENTEWHTHDAAWSAE